MKFQFYTGDLIGLPTNENHIVVRWTKPGTKVLISFTQKGPDVLSCHYASKDTSFEDTNQAIVDFANFIREVMPNISKLCAVVTLPKVASRIAKLGWRLASVVEYSTCRCLVYEYDLKGES